MAARLPLTEIYNNLGVVAGHRDPKAALLYFQKSVNDDPNEPDYRFNLGLALYRTGDLAGASRQLREAISQRPGDNEAQTLLDAASSRGGNPSNPKLPRGRLRTDVR